MSNEFLLASLTNLRGLFQRSPSSSTELGTRRFYLP